MMYVFLFSFLVSLLFRYLDGKHGMLDFERNLERLNVIKEKVEDKKKRNNLVVYDILSLKIENNLYEEKAREKYNMIAEGEVLFIFPEK